MTKASSIYIRRRFSQREGWFSWHSRNYPLVNFTRFKDLTSRERVDWVTRTPLASKASWSSCWVWILRSEMMSGSSGGGFHFIHEGLLYLMNIASQNWRTGTVPVDGGMLLGLIHGRQRQKPTWPELIWKVEVGWKGIDDFPFITWFDKKILVQPESAWMSPSNLLPIVSRVRIEVVPTADAFSRSFYLTKGRGSFFRKLVGIQSASHGLQDCPRILDGRFQAHEGSNRPGEHLWLQSWLTILGWNEDLLLELQQNHFLWRKRFSSVRGSASFSWIWEEVAFAKAFRTSKKIPW